MTSFVLDFVGNNRRKNLQKILSCMRRAITDYDMIQDGDAIAVGVSGGKDSLVLLKALALYRKFSPQHFTLKAISVDLTQGKTDFSKIADLCKQLDVEYTIVPSDILEIVFDIRKEKNPCSLCAKLRRGIINTTAISLGCNKIALGHHADDLVETFFLSLFYEGRISTFAPKSFMDRTKITMIRPLIYEDERNIIAASRSLPVVESCCPANKHTQREYIKQTIKGIQKEIPFVKERVLGALTNPDRTNLFDKATKD